VIVLDTNVLSELAKPEPNASVMAWIGRQPRSNLATTAISEAELAFGLALLPKGRRREALAQAVGRLLTEGLGGRVLAFDRTAAAAYGEIAAARRASGRPVATADARIAAIARARRASVLATRDVSGFEGCGVRVVDPWRA
jgi:predicted nucleic acid-binding protein